MNAHDDKYVLCFTEYHVGFSLNFVIIDVSCYISSINGCQLTVGFVGKMLL